MKILLVGEYSGVHVTLAEALRLRGHSVTTVSDGDSYKSFDRDITIAFIPPRNKLLRKLSIVLDWLGIKGCLQYWRNRKKIGVLRGYDVVQLINPISLNGFSSIPNFLFLRFLKRNNSSIYLCALGDDYFWVKAALRGDFRYSAMDNISCQTIKPYLYSLKYIYGFLFPALNKYAVRVCDKVIPGLYDYYVAYSGFANCSAVIPLPISAEHIARSPSFFSGYPIKIFHGWQAGKESRKGNDLFDEALRKIKNVYGEKVEYMVVKNVPYKEYVRLFADCHIFIDQCYSYDMGMNGLLGAAAGKVVLTGSEPETTASWEPTARSAVVNAEPDVDKIFLLISDFIENPSKIEGISRAALNMVNERHRAENVAACYLKVWMSKTV